MKIDTIENRQASSLVNHMKSSSSSGVSRSDTPHFGAGSEPSNSKGDPRSDNAKSLLPAGEGQGEGKRSSLCRSSPPKLRLFSQPEILKQIGQTRVAMFLNSFAAELREAGIDLPPSEDRDPAYFGAIAKILADPANLPEGLLRAALTLEAAASPECHESLDLVLLRRLPCISLNRHCRLDCALELWFAARDEIPQFEPVCLLEGNGAANVAESGQAASPPPSAADEVSVKNETNLGQGEVAPVPQSKIQNQNSKIGNGEPLLDALTSSSSSGLSPSSVAAHSTFNLQLATCNAQSADSDAPRSENASPLPSAADEVSVKNESNPGQGEVAPVSQSKIKNQNSKIGNGSELSNSQTPELLNSGQALLDALTSLLSRFVVLPKHSAEALALWIVHTYAFELRDVSVYIGIESPEKRCGKTTLLTVLSELAHKAIAAANISPSAFFHVIEKERPTLLIDEADTFLNANEPLRGILNAGYKKKTAYVLRTAPSPKPDNDDLPEPSGSEAERPLPGERDRVRGNRALLNSQTPKLLNSSSTVRYSSWCPKAIATINRLPDTLADRCIIIRIQRKLEGEQCERLRNLDAPSSFPPAANSVRSDLFIESRSEADRSPSPPLGEREPCSPPNFQTPQLPNSSPSQPASRVSTLRQLCSQFVENHAAEIATATPALPASLSDRAVEIWEPLIVIADLAGGDWPERARQAAVHLAAGAQQNNPTGSLLLDIFISFVLADVDRLLTRDLLERLDGMGDRPWKEMRQGNAITDRWLAQQLRPYGIKARTFRVGDIVSRGYLREDFRETFKRYIPKTELAALKGETA